MIRLLVVWALPLALAGCGESMQVIDCVPACPVGTHCTDTGCVPDDNTVRDLAMSISATDGSGCGQCGNTTPYCSPGGQCVACLNDGHCPFGQLCKQVGNSALCIPGCNDDARCGAPGGTTKCCNGACVDTAKDALNCGTCANACRPAHAGAACVNGQCASGACNRGWADCNMIAQDGCEAHLRSDVSNCAACGKACALANAINGCDGTCYIAACLYGFEDCNGTPQDGCETALLNDVRNCGACAKTCPGVQRANVACNQGNCVLASCTQGFADCNKVFNDGCEVNLGTDKVNCGACGAACGQNQICVNGDCTCPPCNYPNARSLCVGKQCIIDQCNQGFGDCDGNVLNGCEQNINSNANNCGACGRVCAQGLVCTNGGCTCPQCNIPNAKTACVNNVCSLDSCLSGWGNCDGNAVNGCEIDLQSNTNNCGACGNVCGAQKPYCLGGVCANVATSCAAIKKASPNSADGQYTIDPDGAGQIAPLQVYCDMSTDGGGWTVVYASASTDNEVGMSSDTLAGGNPLAFGYYNQSRVLKMALSAISKESLFRRKDGAWIKASAPLYDGLLTTPNSHLHVIVNLISSDGAAAQGAIGYTNYNTAGGGDYGVSMFPDGATCQGNTINGFDHHVATYWHLNCGCQRQYLYSYSNGVQDSDQQYNINTGLGAWTATQNCASVESGGVSFYAAMR